MSPLPRWVPTECSGKPPPALEARAPAPEPRVMGPSLGRPPARRFCGSRRGEIDAPGESSSGRFRRVIEGSREDFARRLRRLGRTIGTHVRRWPQRSRPNARNAPTSASPSSCWGRGQDLYPFGGPVRRPPQFRQGYRRRKFTVIVIRTGTATPSTSVGSYLHCLTAATAASSRSGTERSTSTSLTSPVGVMVASRITTP